jgi:DUF4097 and DUF4098 domain-containing protein YvlB
MKSIYLSFAVLALVSCPSFAQSRFSFQDSQTISRTLEFAPGASKKTLDVENVNGFVHVTGYDGTTVEMTANETIRGRTQERVEAAKREVVLDISDRADTIRVIVDHPGKCGNGNNSSSCVNYTKDDQYMVRFDFEIRVPRSAAVRLRTINSGEIRVQGVAGDFDVQHINGSIELADMSGSGRAHTINGSVQAAFAANPKSDCSFHSLNGSIEVTFPRNLSAELRFKTLNGGVYTDFPASVLPAATSSSHRVHVGSGGPEVQLESLNGAIKILQAK